MRWTSRQTRLQSPFRNGLDLMRQSLVYFWVLWTHSITLAKAQDTSEFAFAYQRHLSCRPRGCKPNLGSKIKERSMAEA